MQVLWPSLMPKRSPCSTRLDQISWIGPRSWLDNSNGGDNGGVQYSKIPVDTTRTFHALFVSTTMIILCTRRHELSSWKLHWDPRFSLTPHNPQGRNIISPNRGYIGQSNCRGCQDGLTDASFTERSFYWCHQPAKKVWPRSG